MWEKAYRAEENEDGIIKISVVKKKLRCLNLILNLYIFIRKILKEYFLFSFF